MYKKSEVYVITGFFRDFEETGYDSPSQVFYADTLEEAEKMKTELEATDEYEEVIISEDPEIREFWVGKK